MTEQLHEEQVDDTPPKFLDDETAKWLVLEPDKKRHPRDSQSLHDYLQQLLQRDGVDAAIIFKLQQFANRWSAEETETTDLRYQLATLYRWFMHEASLGAPSVEEAYAYTRKTGDKAPRLLKLMAHYFAMLRRPLMVNTYTALSLNPSVKELQSHTQSLTRALRMRDMHQLAVTRRFLADALRLLATIESMRTREDLLNPDIKEDWVNWALQSISQLFKPETSHG